MSTDRRYEARRFHIEESTNLNNGARTVFIEHMPGGTSVPPHYHNRFSETFDMISGAMKVYSSDSSDLKVLESTAQPLQAGTLVTVPPRKYHYYVVGDEETVLRAIITPGDPDFERLLKVLDGLARDGKADQLGDSVVMMAVVMGLADAHVIGPAGDMLDGVRKEKAEEVENLRKELLEKYDTTEGLERLMAK